MTARVEMYIKGWTIISKLCSREQVLSSGNSLICFSLTPPPQIIDVCDYNHSEHPLGLCISACVLDSQNLVPFTLSARQTEKHGCEGLKDVKCNDYSCATEGIKS